MRLTYQNVKQKVVLGFKKLHTSLQYPVLACGLGHRRRSDFMYASQLGAMLWFIDLFEDWRQEWSN